MTRLKKRWKHLLWIVPAALAVFCALCDFYISLSNRDRLFTDTAEVPEAPVALVLGTAKYHGNEENLFYKRRIAAAAELYKSGKVRGLLLSGDHSRDGYNEPQQMKDDLVAAGVPQYITLDYAGFRTLDSIVRAKKVFGQANITIVTQKFHAQRALFIAAHHGITANAFLADDAPLDWHVKVRFREIFARVVAIVDVWLLDRSPRYLGEPETVQLRN